jgi:RNA polymerase sigma factor (sigma-70 family)
MSTTKPLAGVVRGVRRVALRQGGASLSDGEMLGRYVRHRDEAAFEALVRRYGPMVLGVCRRVLGNDADADDAFQATFLVLVRKAAAVVPRALVGNWLYGVARNTARKAKAMSGKRQAKERHAGELAGARRPAPEAGELHAALDEELGRLPEKYRTPIVLCDLGGRTLREAARQLGWPQGTVAGRLARARALLAARLSQRGLVLSAAALAAALGHGVAFASVPAALVGSTMRAAASFAAGPAAAGVPAKVAALAEGVLRAMLLSKLKVAATVVLLAALAVLAVGSFAGPPAAAPPQAGAGKPAGKTSAAPAPAAWAVRIVLEGHADDVYALAYSRDGTRLATASRDGTVFVWDAATGKKLAALAGHQRAVHAVAFNRDGDVVATAGDDNTARLWDAATGRERHQLEHHHPVAVVAFTPDGKTLLTGGGTPASGDDGGQGELRYWDVATGRERVPFSVELPKRIYNLILSADGKVLVTAAGNAFTVWDWDGKDGLKKRHSAQAEESAFAYGMALSPDARTLAVTWDAKVHLYDTDTGKLRVTPEKSYVGVWGPLAFTPDGKAVAGSIVMQQTEAGWVAQRGSLVRVWDAATGKVRQTHSLAETIAAMAFAPDGRTLAIGCRGGVRFPDGKFIDFSRLVEEKDGSVKLLSVGKGPAAEK